MKFKEIIFAEHFTRTPGARYRDDGPFSAEEFREDILKPALDNHDVVTIILDGAFGYASSFLEGAFGALVRENNFTVEELRSRLNLVSNDSKFLTDEIWHYIENQ